jgi:uncharacterized phage-associated protein
MLGRINTKKYLEVLRFLLDEDTGANNSRLGKVKLMKLLYFTDFDHFARHGTSITGDTYIKLEYGPVPKHGEEMLGRLCEEELLDVGQEPVYNYIRNKYHLRKPLSEIRHLTGDEVATLGAVVAKWKNHTREEIVVASHGDPPWQMADYGSEIPYEFVYYRDDVTGSKDEEPEPRPVRPVS